MSTPGPRGSEAAPDSAYVDVLVAYWGDPALLDQTVSSVLGQTDPAWRLTIVDDCYPDDHARRAYASHADPRVRYLRNETNLGIAGNFERCRRLAGGDLVMFLGCDDLLHPDFVARARARMAQSPDAGLLQVGVDVVDAHGRPADGLVERVKSVLRPKAGDGLVLADEALATSLLRGNWLYWPSLVFRGSALREHAFRQDLPIILDLALIVDLVLAGERLLVVPEVCFTYRRHEASASSTSLLEGDRLADESRFYDETARRLRARGWRRAARVARWRWISRLQALALLPRALRDRSPTGIRRVVRHLLAR